MSEEQQGYDYVLRIRVHERGRGIENAYVWIEVLDLDNTDESPQRQMALDRRQTDANGHCDIPFTPELVELIREGDGTAQLFLIARSQQGSVGFSTVRVNAQRPPKNRVSIPVYAQPTGGSSSSWPGDSQEPFEVQFSTEVLDAILGMAGNAPGAGPSANTGVFDDRFFEERLRRLIGANVRAGDVAGLRREIDRVVVEEEVEGETQFVFRGAGRPRVAKMAPSAAYTTTGSAGSGYTKPGAMVSTYTSASSNGSVPGGGANGGSASPSGGDNLAGPQAILYRRAIAEFDQVRQALAALQPEDSEDSQEFEALRSLTDEGLVDLVTAFSSELRPPVARIEGTFEDLLGPNSEEVGGLIGRLAELGRYPIAASGSDVSAQDSFLTIDEEQEQTRFLELQTYAVGLRRDWDAFRLRMVEPTTLNVRSTILGRRIGFVADAVRELDLALSTAPGDPGERQFEAIDRNGTTLDEYITWLNDFVGDGQAQMRDGSTASFNAIAREAQRLANVANDALEPDPEQDWDGAQVAVLERRLVRRALEELRDNLQAIAPAG